jgi:hypothetical protein
MIWNSSVRSEEEVEGVRTAITDLHAFNSRETYALVLHNYERFNATEAEVINTIETLPQSAWPQPTDMGETLRMYFLNWLFSARIHIEHTEIQLKRRYGKNSEEFKTFDLATSREYDGRFGYSFMSRLRNFAQHYGLPPLVGRIHADVDEDPQRWLELYFEKSRLLGFKKWSSVRDEIEAIPGEEVHLEDLIEQMMEGLSSIEGIVQELDARLMRQHLELLRAYLDSLDECTKP